MTARQRATDVISPTRASLFAGALTLALVMVLAPVFPGETSLDEGDPAYKTFRIDGQVIAEKGDALDQAALDSISAAGLLDNETEADAVAAAVIVSILGGAMVALYLYLFQPREVNTLARLVMVGLLVFLWVAGAKVFLSLTLPDDDRLYLGYILPVASAGMLIATLLDGGLAITVAALLAVLASFAGFYLPDARNSISQEPLQALQMPLAFLLGGLAGIFAVRRAERVNHYAMAGASVGAVTFATLFAFWLLSPERGGDDLLWMLVASGLSGFGCAVITVGATVVLGVIFGVTTRIQLMELGQLSHPLLRDLQEKAPGTFHHSVIVGNLAERAADLIGADSLLVRVGCYFHDIGKIAKPEYYIENQLDTGNPHDKLQPGVSARLVSEHVRIGLQLTGRYRLPSGVRAFIPEHHGTRLVTYFYRKASAHDPTTDPEKFRYPGPKPQTKETAIVMLADSTEAVVRSSRDRSHERIGELVDGVIAERVTEGQFDECDLTMRDLRIIAESFKATLRGIYHPRIEYPSPTKAELQTAGSASVAYLKPPSDPMEAPPTV
ncbi:MAG TPA: HDIG domain-containing protein [Dehalococcoidia bacterium]|nr:HDIG domain-containing protein [Dehalococcoidia bacterium]